MMNVAFLWMRSSDSAKSSLPVSTEWRVIVEFVVRVQPQGPADDERDCVSFVVANDLQIRTVFILGHEHHECKGIDQHAKLLDGAEVLVDLNVAAKAQWHRADWATPRSR